MTEEKETKSGRRKKWMLVAGTILVIAAVFTCISWNSMHPSKTVTMKELEDYASQELINQIECINGSYVVMICDEQEQASDWYALADETDQAEICLLYTSPSPRDSTSSRMPSSA